MHCAHACREGYSSTSKRNIIITAYCMPQCASHTLRIRVGYKGRTSTSHTQSALRVEEIQLPSYTLVQNVHMRRSHLL